MSTTTITSVDATLQCPPNTPGAILGKTKCYTCPIGFSGQKVGNNIICSGIPAGQIVGSPGNPYIPAVAGTLANPAGTPAIPAVPPTPAFIGTCSVGYLSPSSSSSSSLPMCTVMTQFQ